MPSMPGPKCRSQAVSFKEWLVVLGGFRSSGLFPQYCCRVFAFNTASQAGWVEWPSTPHAMCAAASDGHRLLVAGGCPPDGGSAVSEVCVLNKSQGAWDSTSLPPMPRPCSYDCAATVINNKLYVVGNTSSSYGKGPSPTSSTEIQVLSLLDRLWLPSCTVTSSFPRAVHHQFRCNSVIRLQNRIVIDHLVTYDTQLDESNDLPALPEGRNFTTMTSMDNQIIVFHTPCSGLVYTVDAHVLRNGNWQSLQSPSIKRDWGFSACTDLNGVIYLVGGMHNLDTLSRVECFK